jgi:hypothetical protein
MSEQLTLWDTDNATSSPGSADGASPCASPDGRTIGRSGQAHVPVSRFRSLDADKAMPTDATCGPIFTASSPSTSLQLSLESRLRAKMDVDGSPEYALIWKQQDMPSGPPIFVLRASPRPISDNGYIGWPTPTLSMSQPGANVSITGRRPNGSHATMSTQAVARLILDD